MSITNSNNKLVFTNGIVIPNIKCDDSLIIPSTQPSSELGSLYLNTTNNTLSVFNGSSWVSTPGPTGQPGSNGNNGYRGPTGQPGTNGNDGSQGPTGQPGANGNDGSQGPTGQPGEPGANGSSGPAFSAYASGQQTSIGNSVITFNMKEFDTDNTYNTSNSRWTPGVAGYYQINALVTCIFASGGAGDIYINLRKNGTQIKASTRFSSSSSFIQPSIHTIVYLSDTDYIDIHCLTTTVFNTQNVFGMGTNQAWVYFNGCFLKSA
jgi:hypothetical protein